MTSMTLWVLVAGSTCLSCEVRFLSQALGWEGRLLVNGRLSSSEQLASSIVIQPWAEAWRRRLEWKFRSADIARNSRIESPRVRTWTASTGGRAEISHPVL